jgi:hypothetical protein
MHLTYEQGRLLAQVNGQPPTMLMAEKENYFYFEEAEGYIEFPKAGSNQFDSRKILQGGRIRSAFRFVPSWGLIGSATIKGWEQEVPDIPMGEDSLRAGYWLIRNITLKDGEMKFRFNNDWNTNYGNEGGDGKADLHGKNIKIAAGIYDIILDLTDKNQVRYNIRKIH